MIQTSRYQESPRVGPHVCADVVAQSHDLSSKRRNDLIESHLPQVRFIADRLAPKLPRTVDREDLIGAGVLGLIDAVQKFDSSRGVLFKTYAEMRIRGAMLDSLRALDWVPRSVRRRAREVESAYSDIEAETGRLASEEDVATRLGISVHQLQVLLGELSGIKVAEILSDDDEGRGVKLRQVPSNPTESPLARYEREELRSRLARAIDRLPKRERDVIALYFGEELNMKEIGSLLGVTESRVSQIRSQAILHLRSALGAKRFSRAS